MTVSVVWGNSKIREKRYIDREGFIPSDLLFAIEILVMETHGLLVKGNDEFVTHRVDAEQFFLDDMH